VKDEQFITPNLEALGTDQIAALDRAANACGRLSAAVESSRSAFSSFLLIRHAVRVHDGAAELATELLLADLADASVLAHNAEYDSTPAGRHPSIALALDEAGLGELLTDRLRATLNQFAAADPRHVSSVLRAAITAGVIVTPSPTSADAQRGAALAGALMLAGGGSLAAPWLAPYRLDAAARGAAVQVDRSGDWSEWIRAWCVMLAREASIAERAVRNAELQLELARDGARAQRRVGATDDGVLQWLNAHAAFTIRDASAGLGLTTPTVGTAIERLAALGFATEITGQKRDRVWASSTLLGLATAY